jgi:predicted glycosyl hydrolase (DUF1957 family)
VDTARCGSVAKPPGRGATSTATRYAEARIRSHVHRLRHLGHLVETGVIEGADSIWLDDLCQRDNFLAELRGDELRRPFD